MHYCSESAAAHRSRTEHREIISAFIRLLPTLPATALQRCVVWLTLSNALWSHENALTSATRTHSDPDSKIPPKNEPNAKQHFCINMMCLCINIHNLHTSQDSSQGGSSRSQMCDPRNLIEQLDFEFSDQPETVVSGSRYSRSGKDWRRRSQAQVNVWGRDVEAGGK